MKKINKNLLLISIVFFLVFMGYSSCQQYLTNYLEFLGHGGIGFYILILIYTFFMLGNLIYKKIASKIGIKKIIQLGILMYFFFVFSLFFGNPYLIMFFAVLLGIGASFVRTGSNIYIIFISSDEDIGNNSGIFNTFYAMGITLGSFILGLLISNINYSYSFLIFSMLTFFGFVLSFGLKNVKNENIISELNNKPNMSYNIVDTMKKCFKNSLILRFSILRFTTFFIFGLVISYLPIQIRDLFGVNYVGYISSLFFAFLLLFSYVFGKLSDKRGRRKMILIAYISVFIGLLFLFYYINNYFFILGVCLVAIFYTGMNTLLFSFVGDIVSKKNIEYVTPFFRIIQNLGAIISIFLSKILFSNNIYLLSLFIIFLNIILLHKYYYSPMKKIKELVDISFDK